MRTRKVQEIEVPGDWKAEREDGQEESVYSALCGPAQSSYTAGQSENC